MASSFKLKTYPELLASATAHVVATETAATGIAPDTSEGSFLRSILEAVSLADAGTYLQIGKLRRLFSLFNAKDTDLDERFVDLGAEIWPELRRRSAATSICQITVSSTAALLKTTLAADVYPGTLSFPVAAGTGALFPSSGALTVEFGTERTEDVVYTRDGDTFSLTDALGGFRFGHAAGTQVVRVSTRSVLALPAEAGEVSAVLLETTGAAWPATGAVIFERGTIREEKRTYTRSGDILTLGAALTFTHTDGTIVIQTVPGGTNYTIPAGRVCYAPATDSTKQINFRTKASGVLLDGDLTSALIDVESESVGSSTRVGAHTITQWQGGAPFPGAVVTNPIAAARGRDRENDSEYLQRGLAFIQSLSRGTPLAISTLLLGVRDPVSTRTVEFAQIVEPVVLGDKSLLYITDGTPTFGLTQLPFIGRDVVIRDAELNDRRGRLSQDAPYSYTTTPVLPRLFKSIQRGSATSVGVDYLEDSAQSMVTNYYVGAYLKTDDDQFYRILSNTAIRFTVDAGTNVPSLGSYAVVDFGTNPQISSTSTSVSSNTLTDTTQTMSVNAHVGKWLKDSAGALWSVTANTATSFTLAASGATPNSGAYTLTAGKPQPLTPVTDFNFNESKGDLELTVGNALLAHDCLVAASDGASPSTGAYLYTLGLGAYVQKVVNGSSGDPTQFPGLRATGTQVLVKAPTAISQAFVIKVIAVQGITSAALAPAVKIAVQTYVNSLGIGENIILAKVNAAVLAVPGVEDVTIISPTSNPTIADGQLVRCTDANIEVV